MLHTKLKHILVILIGAQNEIKLEVVLSLCIMETSLVGQFSGQVPDVKFYDDISVM